MNNLIRGTTPSLIFKNTSNVSISRLEEIWFIISQKSTGTEVLYKLSDGDISLDTDNNTMTVNMSQEQTLQFNPDNVEIQIRCLDIEGRAYASDIFTENMARILKGGVISAT